jgi:hypothetical protein
MFHVMLGGWRLAVMRGPVGDSMAGIHISRMVKLLMWTPRYEEIYFVKAEPASILLKEEEPTLAF